MSMKVPKITGIIDRRILINYRVDKDVVAAFLPQPFRPKLVQDKAVVGICLIRLKEIRPVGFPKAFGISSENGAHRVAVEWSDNNRAKEGVYIPRRDSSSRLNSLVGGRLFPGIHHLADFKVNEKDGSYFVQFNSDDDTSLSIQAQETEQWSSASVFENLQCASAFFEKGAIGYSPGNKYGSFDGLELKTSSWQVSPLHVTAVRSSFFENETVFPPGSVEFDNALLMKNIQHEWTSLDEIRKSV